MEGNHQRQKNRFNLAFSFHVIFHASKGVFAPVCFLLRVIGIEGYLTEVALWN